MAQQSITNELLKRHPLQRLQAPSRGASAILHVLGLSSFAYSFIYLVQNPNPVNESYGWHMQFLTIIGLSLATATFAFGLLADLTLSHTLFQIKNTLSVASAPMECLISLLYWSLRAIDPKLVLPDWTEPLAFKADLSFHAIPAAALAVDLLFFSPPWTIAFVPALGLSGVIAFGYWFWIERCYQFNKFYPYPLFDLLNTTQRVGLFAASAFLMTLSTAALIWLYGVINGRDVGGVGSDNVKRSKSGNVKGK
ncbi:Putative FAR-17a/AIG1-like protein [Septoria linicola]|uniref:FAR-17a/AIG1-like protein n=1 Tax=Septoria linicola TaxID=215465 RepID=A0A9Q9EPH5_9PEZI|nr:Putative FAR-17a/AIG1-like protein [Septoria linicola]